MEIGGLYIITTFAVVVISLLLSIPIVNVIMRWMFSSYLYTQMTGYLVVCVIQMIKIKKIPKSDALKNVE